MRPIILGAYGSDEGRIWLKEAAGPHEGRVWKPLWEAIKGDMADRKCVCSLSTSAVRQIPLFQPEHRKLHIKVPPLWLIMAKPWVKGLM